MAGLLGRAQGIVMLAFVLAVCAASGCSAVSGGPSRDHDAVRILARSGEMIAKASYVEICAEVEVRQVGGMSSIERIRILFGPRARVKVDNGTAIAFSDGVQGGTVDPRTGKLFLFPMDREPGNLVMLIGTALGGVSLPEAVARVKGPKWWTTLYGKKAIVEMRPKRIAAGRRCHVIAIQPQGEQACVLWSIDELTGLFESWHMVGTEDGDCGRGVVGVRYRAIDFPNRIADEAFRVGRQCPTAKSEK